MEDYTKHKEAGLKYSPGKWDNGALGMWISAFCILPDGRHRTYPVAKIETKPLRATLDEEDRANSKLITAAPLLLEALKEALANPERIKHAATAYYISQRYPVTESVQKDADW